MLVVLVWLLGFSTPEIRRFVQFPVWTIAFIIGTVPTMTNLGLDRHAPVWFVAIGMMLWPMFIEVTRSPSERPLHRNLAGGLLLLLIGTVVLGALWYSGQPMRRIIPLTILPVLLAGTSSFLLAGAGWVCNTFPDAIRNCGRASYAIYLLHMPLFFVLQSVTNSATMTVTFSFVGTVILTLMLEWGLQPQVSHYFLNRRMRAQSLSADQS